MNRGTVSPRPPGARCFSTAERRPHLLALCAVFALALTWPRVASAQPGLQGQVRNTLLGEIENLHVDNPNDPWSGGWVRVGGQDFILPRNLLIDLPANRLSLHDLFAEAPPDCAALGQSGLARADSCLGGRPGAYVTTMNANRLASGEIIVGEIWIDKGIESLEGVISYINYDDGYFRINGTGTGGGTMVRINDPISRHTIQKGLGCLPGSQNCSADPRFTEDSDNYTVTGTTGYPICIPSTQGFSAVAGGIRTTGAGASGTGDPFCPDTNRAINPVPNSTRFAPIKVGDHVRVDGNVEVINGVRFLSAHTVNLHVAFLTQNSPTQPDYMIFDEVGWDAPGFNNGRTRALMIGFTTLPDSQLDIYALRVDPATGENSEDVIASTVGNPDSTIGVGFAGKGSIFKFQYDVDFLQATKQTARRPCPVLIGAGFSKCTSATSSAEDFAVLSPLSREIIGRSRRTLNPGIVARDINGRPTQSGEYLSPVGITHPEFVEIDLGALMTPYIFEGEVWNWDRRLSPGGCLDSGCESTPQPLDPFPSSGIDPRVVLGGASAPPPLPDRIFTFFTPTGATITQPNGIQLPQLTPHLLGGYPASTTPAPGTLPGPSPLPPPLGGGTGATVSVPNLVGQQLATAQAALAGAGLTLGSTSVQNDITAAGTVLSQNPTAGTGTLTGSAVALVISLGPSNAIVPNVVGQTQSAASTAIASAGLIVGAIANVNSSTVPAGSVISQNPAAGTSVAPGSAVALTISLGAANVLVPNVVSLTQAAASTAITGAGLTVGAITNVNSNTVPAGSVISQNPASGTSVTPGSAVALTVSLGPLAVTVPNVVGQTQAAATTAFANAGLTVGAVTQVNSGTVPAGNVISQNPAAGASVAAGTAVALTVSLGPTAAAPAIDKTAFSDGAGTRTTTAFVTAAANEQIVAFAASDGPPSANSQTLTISGSGLTWTRVQRSATRFGVAEIWTARAAAAGTNISVTSTQAALGFHQSLTVVAFTGVTALGASASGGAVTGAASLSLVSQAAGSLVFGIGNDWDSATARTLPAGQSMVHQFVDTAVGDTFWVQRADAATSAAGQTITLSTAGPTGDQWNLAIVELRP